VQRGQAEEIMGEGIHGTNDPTEPTRDKHMGTLAQQSADHPKDEGAKAMAAKEKFEASGPGGEDANPKAAYSVAHHAMAHTGELTNETWDDKTLDTEVENWIQEELYIHSKLLIVDDRIVVCGSSNLNDRSQMGNHDSELSIVMEDRNLVDSTMDGQPFKAGWHATSLRRYLWREHLGLLPPQELDAKDDINAHPPGDDSPNDPWDKDDSWRFVQDPLGDDLWKMWTEQASTNTDTFRHLFHADPDDHCESLLLGMLPGISIADLTQSGHSTTTTASSRPRV
jgi:phospholipase D1/2